MKISLRLRNTVRRPNILIDLLQCIFKDIILVKRRSKECFTTNKSKYQKYKPCCKLSLIFAIVFRLPYISRPFFIEKQHKKFFDHCFIMLTQYTVYIWLQRMAAYSTFYNRFTTLLKMSIVIVSHISIIKLTFEQREINLFL